jgi:type IV pilus assembly protein PilM
MKGVLHLALFASDTIAIDIGSYSIKGVLLGSGSELKKFATVPTPTGAIEGGIIRNPEQIVAAVLQLWKGIGVKGASVISVVPGQHIFVRQITLPIMKKAELDQAVRFQAEGQIPIPPTDIVLDYSIIATNKASKQVDVLVVATRKSVVQQLLHIFTLAKIQPKVLDIEALALSRLFINSNSKSKKNIAGMDLIASVGASNTHISFFEGDIPRFTRSIPFGGQRFTRALSMERSISMESAEERKLAGDLPEESENLLGDFVNELKRSIDFYQSQNKEKTVRQIVLTGGGAQMIKLHDYTASKFDIPITSSSISEQVKILKKFAQPANLEAFRTVFAPALGLAVRGVK